MIAACLIVLVWTNLIALAVAWKLYARVCDLERRIARHNRYASEALSLHRERVNGMTG